MFYYPLTWLRLSTPNKASSMTLTEVSTFNKYSISFNMLFWSLSRGGGRRRWLSRSLCATLGESCLQAQKGSPPPNTHTINSLPSQCCAQGCWCSMTGVCLSHRSCPHSHSKMFVLGHPWSPLPEAGSLPQSRSLDLAVIMFSA